MKFEGGRPGAGVIDCAAEEVFEDCIAELWFSGRGVDVAAEDVCVGAEFEGRVDDSTCAVCDGFVGAADGIDLCWVEADAVVQDTRSAS